MTIHTFPVNDIGEDKPFIGDDEIVQGSWTHVMHDNRGRQTAEVSAQDVVISSAQDALDILGGLAYHGAEEVILHEHHVHPSFFDLKTGLAGEILQKCSTYGWRLALVGDFSKYESESLKAFIRESNRGRVVCFVNTVPEALRWFSETR